MKTTLFQLIAFLFVVSVIKAQTIVQEGTFDPGKIKSELTQKYKSYNGKLEDQTLEKWDAYFLNSPNIGNMHEGNYEISWKTFHEGTISHVKSKPKGEMLMENLEIYPINSNTAWVKGTMVTKMNNQIYRDIFFDSVVKTVDGWRVFLSVVKPESK